MTVVCVLPWQVGPRFGQEGSFEAEYGARWKQLYELEKQRREQLDQEMKMEMDKLRDQMEFARRQHETEMLREQLRRREMEQERSKSDWDVRQAQREEERRRLEEDMQRRQESMQARMRQSEEDLKRRQQENKLFMQVSRVWWRRYGTGHVRWLRPTDGAHCYLLSHRNVNQRTSSPGNSVVVRFSSVCSVWNLVYRSIALRCSH